MHGVPAAFEPIALVGEEERLGALARIACAPVAEISADRLRCSLVERDLPRASGGLRRVLADDDVALVLVLWARQDDVAETQKARLVGADASRQLQPVDRGKEAPARRRGDH